ncbi:MAG: radical family heme chaperone HemW [Bacteroidota bacterium]|jgi:oxygen-independent coproporphyrinogen-3 oxidase
MDNIAFPATGLYIHIPYCRKACHYCNFHFSTSLNNRTRFLEALIKEIDLTPGKKIREVTTVYFGGGTPSILFRTELRAIVQELHKRFQIHKQAEWTLEVNPDDLNENKLAFWKEMGFNRLSVGIQSFRDQDLNWMNRSHSAIQAIEGINMIRKTGFDNFSIDLIYGVPGLSDEDWKQNIQQAIDFQVPHISAYALTVEPKTALSHLIENKKVADVDPEQQARQFLMLMDMLNLAGYEHYEISNFAKAGYRSQHNSSYWAGTPYFGLGPGSHSFDGDSRYWNISNNNLYIESIQAGIIPFDKEELTEIQHLNEYIMTALRTIEGIDLQWIRSKWNEQYAVQIQSHAQKYITLGNLIATENRLILTKNGKLFADGIAADLFFLP